MRALYAGYYVMRDQVSFEPQKLFGRGRGWNGEPELGLVKSHEA